MAMRQRNPWARGPHGSGGSSLQDIPDLHFSQSNQFFSQFLFAGAGRMLWGSPPCHQRPKT